MTHKEIFTEIYDKKLWGGGSGGGSTPENTVYYRAILQAFMKENKIETVIDFGCGDWQFSKLINWDGIQYLGIDCVDIVIDENKKLFETANIKFICTTDITARAELLIVKDVFQHWCIEAIDSFLLKAITNFKYILITNNSDQIGNNQELILEPYTRSMSAKFDPLKKYNAKILAELITTEKKEISLITI